MDLKRKRLTSELSMLDSEERPIERARLNKLDDFEDLEDEYKSFVLNNRLIDIGVINYIMPCKVCCVNYGSRDVTFMDKFTIGCVNVMQIHCMRVAKKNGQDKAKHYR